MQRWKRNAPKSCESLASCIHARRRTIIRESRATEINIFDTERIVLSLHEEKVPECFFLARQIVRAPPDAEPQQQAMGSEGLTSEDQDTSTKMGRRSELFATGMGLIAVACDDVETASDDTSASGGESGSALEDDFDLADSPSAHVSYSTEPQAMSSQLPNQS